MAQIVPNQSQGVDTAQAIAEPTVELEKILCPHCKRTATNGIKCKGICVADNDY